jgi:hypothetical protein
MKELVPGASNKTKAGKHVKIPEVGLQPYEVCAEHFI